jgi:dienelactone hydrolase
MLPALLSVPPSPRGLVVFVHGSGSSRFSPRNQAVAALLNQAGLATLLFDLLTPAEAERDRIDASLRFRIDLFRDRLLDSLSWLAAQPALAGLFPVGLFGASSGAAAALQAAAARPEAVAAVVSRGGRPDLAGEALASVLAPTLLIVGGEDRAVLRLNREAAAGLQGFHRLEVVPGASHLFEEPGALELAAQLACDWFLRHLPASELGSGPHPDSFASPARGPIRAEDRRVLGED